MLDLSERGLECPRLQDAEAVLPVTIALLAPALPLLILLADVLPPGLPIEGGGIYAKAIVVLVPIAMAIALCALLLRHGFAAFTRPPVVAALATFILIQILAARSGFAPLSSRLEIAAQAAAALVFVASYWSLADDRRRRFFLASFFASGIVACAFAIDLVLAKHPPAAFAYLHGRAAGTFLQPNEFGGYLLFLIPLGLAQLAAPSWLKALGFVAAGVGAVGLALSVSRAAWLGIAIGLPFLIGRFGRRAVIAYAGAAIAIVALGALEFGNLAHDPSENALRITVWRGAARMALRFPFTGVGPAAFSKVYPSYEVPSATNDEVHAHDVPLNVLVEEGVFGFAALAWVVWSCVAALRRTASSIAPVDRERSFLFAGLCTAFAASIVQNLVDDVTTFVLILWWPMLGLALSLGRSGGVQVDRSARADRYKKIAAVAAGSLLLASCSGSAPSSSTSPAPSLSPAAPNIASVTAHGAPGHPISVENIVNSRPEYRLTAESVTYLPNRSQGTFSNVRIAFYKGGNVRLAVSAPSADLNLKSYDVVLRGRVKAVNSAGDSLSADEVSYDGKSHQLRAAGNVVAVNADGTTIAGDRAIADLDLQIVKIFGHIGMTSGSR